MRWVGVAVSCSTPRGEGTDRVAVVSGVEGGAGGGAVVFIGALDGVRGVRG